MPTLFEKVWNAHAVRTLPERPDAAVRRPAPRARGDQPAGVRHDAPARLARPVPGAHVRHRRPHRADQLAEAPVHRPHRRGDDDRRSRRNCREFGIQLFAPGDDVARAPGHRARDRPRAGADAAGDDDRVRRQPHLHARRAGRDRVRHRHLAGARRARVAVPGARSAEGAPHRRQRRSCGRASTPRT